MTDTAAPRRVLRRAANLLNSAGQPVSGDLFFGASSGVPARQSSLKNSIKRKLSHVKRVSLQLTRSKSTPAPSANLENGAVHKRKSQASRGHGRSQSVLDARPPFSSSSNAPCDTPKRHSLPPALPRPQYPSLRSYKMTDVAVPLLLQHGTPMIKVSAKRQKRFDFRVDPDQGQIVYESNRTKIIPIESIKEMRFGLDARYYREQFQLSKEYEDRWITIIYILDGTYKTLHLVAATQDVFNMWHATLSQLHAIRQELMSGLGNLEMRQAIWEKHYWKGADVQSDQKLSFEEIERLCRRLNINASSEELLSLFKQADVHKRQYLDFNDFRAFVKMLKARPELNRLYKKLAAKTGNEFTFETFAQFMAECQKSTLTRDELKPIFDKYATLESDTPRPPDAASKETSQDSTTTESLHRESRPAPTTMSAEGFASFLLSTENSAIVDAHRGVWHDMTRPLSEYFISSSHNTYLVGHQLVGVSTVEGYIRALLHSCRSVELDIYDGENEPVIFHGKTFTSKVSVREVCEAIRKYGFVSSPYPIIISAEIHCGIAQQEMLAGIMREVFGDALVTAPEDPMPPITVLPSPEELKGKILLKAKNLLLTPPPPAEPDILISDSSTTTSTSSDTDFVERAGSMLSRIGRRRGSSAADSPTKKSPEGGKAKPKMSMALASLLVYTVGVKCRGINKKEEYAVEHIFSLSENSINKQMKAGMIDLIKHNKTHLVRVYPKGTRLSSTNYEPHRYWSAGAQLVALNWQTFDLGYMINHAMFQRNGRAGYVLKPYPLREVHKDLLTKHRQHYLDLTIISAQQLPRPKDANGVEIIGKTIADPFVEVSVHVPDWTNPLQNSLLPSPPSSDAGPAATPSCTLSYRTSVVKNNGFNPVWEERLRVPFTCVSDMHDLIFVRFAVRQADGDDEEPLAYFCASLGSLQAGYRHLPLHDAQLSQYLFSTLFVHIDLVDTP